MCDETAAHTACIKTTPTTKDSHNGNSHTAGNASDTQSKYTQYHDKE
jgi:hypothetical protein